jgi:AcrR family transcriptional regulator
MEAGQNRSRGWRRRKHARPLEILEAAKIVFADKGYNATRMVDVAGHAGVTKGTIYLYFPSKQHLYEAASCGASSL